MPLLSSLKMFFCSKKKGSRSSRIFLTSLRSHEIFCLYFMPDALSPGQIVGESVKDTVWIQGVRLLDD